MGIPGVERSGDARSRRGASASLILVLVVLIVVVVTVILVSRRRSQVTSGAVPAGGAGTSSAGATPSAAGGIPILPNKPRPTEITFQGCPPDGDGGDRALNRQKNRVDEGAYVPVSLNAIVTLPWPPAIEQKRRANWSRRDAAEVEKYEGVPVQVIGYIAGAKLEGPESPNCHGADAAYRDFHVWLTDTSSTDRRGSVVIEMTPRVRTNHPEWTVAALRKLSRSKTKVRVSGWLMMDQEHPDQVGRTRGTIWEIHPVMRVEVERGGRWAPLGGT
jgi:hypothetical protein